MLVWLVARPRGFGSFQGAAMAMVRIDYDVYCL